MKILSIETSFDETAASVIEDGSKILSNKISSSQDIHTKTGGAIPESAAREQLKYIIQIIGQSLSHSGDPHTFLTDKIDSIAVTYGPGLIGSLLVGVETAKALSLLYKKPLIPVNHLLGHVYANWLNKEINNYPEFPLLALIISGGHTDLIYMKDHNSLERIGGTRDDAAGEAFDKTARIIGLPYPGGPSISKQANIYFDKNQKLDLFPRPMVNEKNFDWSFSGLKTSVYYYVKKNENLDVAFISAQVQEAIIDSLLIKSIRAIKKFQPKSFLLGGGVSSNTRLRNKFQDEIDSKSLRCRLHVPDPIFCTDNAAAIGACAYFQNKPKSYKDINANPDLEIGL